MEFCDGDRWRWLEQLPAKRFDAELSRVFDKELVDLAIARTRTEFPEEYWTVYRLRVMKELSGQEVSEQTGIKVATIHVYKGRFEKRLKAVIEGLGGES